MSLRGEHLQAVDAVARAGGALDARVRRVAFPS